MENSERKQDLKNSRQISVAGVMGSTALWALVIGLFRFAVKLQQGTHTLAQARLSEVLILTATGLLFVAIVLPIVIVTGSRQHVVPVSLGCFIVGLLSIPMLFIVLLTLGRFGIVNLDF